MIRVLLALAAVAGALTLSFSALAGLGQFASDADLIKSHAGSQSTNATPMSNQVLPMVLGTFNAGLVRNGIVFQHEFLLTNQSAVELTVTNVVSLCDCVQVVSWPKKVKSGSAGKVQLLIQPQRFGPFSPMVQVDFVNQSVPGVFAISGWVDDGVAEQWTNMLVRAVDVVADLGVGDRQCIVDVRPENQYRLGRIPGSVNLPLYMVKGKTFLKQKRVVLVGRGFEEQILLQEANRLRTMGFSAPCVLEGGFRLWQMQGGKLEGDHPSASVLALIESMEFLRAQIQPGWVVINLGSKEDLADWPFGWPVVTISALENDFKAKLAKAIQEDPLAKRMVLIAPKSESYAAFDSVVGGLGMPVFYLKGGWLAYRESLAMATAMEKRRLVSSSSQTAARFGPYRRSSIVPGACCGRK